MCGSLGTEGVHHMFVTETIIVYVILRVVAPKKAAKLKEKVAIQAEEVKIRVLRVVRLVRRQKK